MKNQTQNKIETVQKLMVEHAKATESFTKQLNDMGFSPNVVYLATVPEVESKESTALSSIVAGTSVGLFKALLELFSMDEKFKVTVQGALLAHQIVGKI